MTTGRPVAVDLGDDAADRDGGHGRISRTRILEGADAVDLDPDDVAGLEVARRVEADADAGRRAGGDDVAGLQRHAGRDRRDDRRDVEDQEAGIRALADARH